MTLVMPSRSQGGFTIDNRRSVELVADSPRRGCNPLRCCLGGGPHETVGGIRQVVCGDLRGGRPQPRHYRVCRGNRQVAFRDGPDDRVMPG
jgi:hypothetical protein